MKLSNLVFLFSILMAHSSFAANYHYTCYPKTNSPGAISLLNLYFNDNAPAALQLKFDTDLSNPGYSQVDFISTKAISKSPTSVIFYGFANYEAATKTVLKPAAIGNISMPLRLFQKGEDFEGVDKFSPRGTIAWSRNGLTELYNCVMGVRSN